MVDTIIEWFLVLVAFIVGVFQEHLRDVGKAISDGDWEGAVSGMWNSGTFIALGILVVIFIVVWLLKRNENKKQHKAELLQQAIATKLGINLGEFD